jgi:ERCC4-related helicase
MKSLARTGCSVRVLALSATPGADLRAIQQVLSHFDVINALTLDEFAKVVHSLKISALEFRSEDDEDLAPYVHDKQVILNIIFLKNK